MKYLPMISVFLLILPLGGCGQMPAYIHSIDLKNVNADGSPPRVEREFKYSLEMSNLTGFDTGKLASEINAALGKEIQNNDSWQAMEFVDGDYYTDNEAVPFVYFDVYFDTDDNLNYRHAISYRLRERFKSLKNYNEYVENQEDKDNWPYRIEFQAKVGREELGNGFSIVEESRFEFREESEPFGKSNPPPSPPWDLNEFIGYFQTGKFKNYYTWPAKAVVSHLVPDYTNETELMFKPVLILITERQRQHLNIKTPWGSGPNPEQAYVISIDSSEIYNGPEYLDYLRDKKSGKNMLLPELKGKFLEIEVEFERNVSRELDNAILKAEKNGNDEELRYLKSVRDAFLADQVTIMNTIKNYFEKKGIRTEPANKSKYLRAFELLGR